MTHHWLINVASSSTGKVNLNILDKQLSKNGCIVTWEVPEDEGGTEVINYILEMREPQMPGFAGLGWSLVSSEGNKRMIKVNGTEGHEYFFRVAAENKCGVGPTVESKKPTLFVDPFVKPMPVRDVKVSVRGSDYIEFSYSKPEWGGGESVTHYKLLGKMSDSSEWKQQVVKSSKSIMSMSTLLKARLGHST